MLSFRQFTESTDPQFLYHGTSSHYLPSILKNGLIPGNRKSKTSPKVYVSHHLDVARDEAWRTVEGDETKSGKHSNGIGGTSHVIVINKNHPSLKDHKWKEDKEYDPGLSHYTNKHIPKEAISHVLTANQANREILAQSKKHKQQKIA